MVYLTNADPTVESAPLRVFGYEFVAQRVARDKLRGIIAVPMDLEPGLHPLEIELPSSVEGADVQVVPRRWDSSELKVSKTFTEKKSKALLARLASEERAWNALWPPPASAPRFAGGMLRPVDGEVTGIFGTRRVFNGKVNSTHYGLDLDGRVGTPIRAMQGGRVVMSAMRWASGGTVVIDHGGGLFSSYFHMSKRRVNVGAWVKGGDLLGAVGATGRVTGPHLHLAVLVRARSTRTNAPPRGLYVDPEPVLRLRLEGDSSLIRTPTVNEELINKYSVDLFEDP